ncbi:MAG: TorF family putative porin [Gammaproteobacteria bacterium]|nr:TorF family putative porin [Gammaproteobacteria bacterium]
MKKIVLPILATVIAAASISAHADQTVTKKKIDYKNTATPAAVPEAVNPLTGTFDITSNYVFRGISNSNNLPAVQGGLTYTFHSTGIYFNIWGSNVNFADPQGNTATLEFDAIAGIANSIGEHFSYDINFDRYNYPKTASSYYEAIANAKWYFVTAQIGFSSNVFGYHGNGTYYNLGVNYDVPPDYAFGLDNVNVKGGVGHYSLPKSKGLSSYNDYLVQVSKGIGIYNLAVAWTDTNYRSVDLNPVKGSTLIGTVTANF